MPIADVSICRDKRDKTRQLVLNKVKPNMAAHRTSVNNGLRKLSANLQFAQATLAGIEKPWSVPYYLSLDVVAYRTAPFSKATKTRRQCT